MMHILLTQGVFCRVEVWLQLKGLPLQGRRFKFSCQQILSPVIEFAFTLIGAVISRLCDESLD